MRDELSALTEVAARFFESQVAGSWVPGYLASRGFDADALRPWGIGYAPVSWTALTDYARDLGFGHEAIVIAGLARRSARGSLIDLFRDRLMFPVRAPDGTVAGFIGRAPPAADRSRPVYLNTPATPLYRKGALLFGLHEAIPALADGARPILAEGPLDALAITLAATHPPAPPPVGAIGQGRPVRFVGIAPCGTALTAAQVRLLGAAAGAPAGTPAGVTVAFDADRAGRRAAVRAFHLLRAVADDIAIAPLPDGGDPAGYLGDHGPAALGALLDASGPLADLVIDAKLAGFEQWLGFTDGKFLALHAVAPVAAGLPSGQVARQVARIAARLDLSHAEVTCAVTTALDLLFAHDL